MYRKPYRFEETQDIRQFHPHERRDFMALEEFCDAPLKGLQHGYRSYENDCSDVKHQEIELDFQTACKFGMLHRSKHILRAKEKAMKQKKKQKAFEPRAELAPDPELAQWLRDACQSSNKTRTQTRCQQKCIY